MFVWSERDAGTPSGSLVGRQHGFVLDEAQPADLGNVVFPGTRHAHGEAIKLTGASRNTLKQHFRALVERGHLSQQGSGRGVWYALR